MTYVHLIPPIKATRRQLHPPGLCVSLCLPLSIHGRDTQTHELYADIHPSVVYAVVVSVVCDVPLYPLRLGRPLTHVLIVHVEKLDLLPEHLCIVSDVQLREGILHLLACGVVQALEHVLSNAEVDGLPGPLVQEVVRHFVFVDPGHILVHTRRQLLDHQVLIPLGVPTDESRPSVELVQPLVLHLGRVMLQIPRQVGLKCVAPDVQDEQVLCLGVPRADCIDLEQRQVGLDRHVDDLQLLRAPFLTHLSDERVDHVGVVLHALAEVALHGPHDPQHRQHLGRRLDPQLLLGHLAHTPNLEAEFFCLGESPPEADGFLALLDQHRVNVLLPLLTLLLKQKLPTWPRFIEWRLPVDALPRPVRRHPTKVAKHT
mmetsp:Transcript_4437/g.10217  ORF Transcript_4437/g.10217 Transcript_4437/m.10217 type:complete len:372 (+) Transcript_4437:92-1207(+)